MGFTHFKGNKLNVDTSRLFSKEDIITDTDAAICMAVWHKVADRDVSSEDGISFFDSIGCEVKGNKSTGLYVDLDDYMGGIYSKYDIQGDYPTVELYKENVRRLLKEGRDLENYDGVKIQKYSEETDSADMVSETNFFDCNKGVNDCSDCVK